MKLYYYLKMYLATIFALLIICSCKNDDSGSELNVEEDAPGMVYFTESLDHFANPERGFYRYSETRASNYTPLSLNTLVANRGLTSSSGASYQSYNTLVFRYFILDDFTDGPLSEDFLQQVSNDFDIAREAGVKVIVRFTYTVTSNAGDCDEGFICPPYGDGPKEVVLDQIGQLGPVLTEHVDVIHVIQMGFIGTWGENYYTDYFGDASSNGVNGKLLDENWTDRIQVLQALLDQTPEELMIQVRYPQMKQRAVFGIEALTSVAALTVDQAFDGSDQSRIAFHNDCLFASSADFGTYEDYGNTSTPRRTDISNLKSYFAEDSKFVVVGGETCFDGYSPQNNCAPEGMADSDLRLLHYTYLNADYNNQVNNDWVDGGCMSDIRRNLGYRFVLDSASFISNQTEADQLDLELYIRNMGYASPVKNYKVDFVLKSENGEVHSFSSERDIRFWFESIVLEESVDISGLSPGEYKLYLHVHDAHSSISDRPEYAIRFANDEMWEAETGFNLLTSVEVF